jgi:uncharacterized membrane protein YphA (DoxX/SURF4 family)
MTIWTLLIGFAITAAVLLALTWKRLPNKFISFLQYFTGVWFVFSGIVKAIDPWGTAFKMQQYFGEFETTFEGAGMKGIAQIFPFLNEHTLTFSIMMIIVEIVLGVMLLIGYLPRLTAWLFLVINLFFTILTGYTHLTGYVGDGVNFFEFSKWSEYVKTNMKVTDCGCFGDFLKLEPTVSFYKDLYLLTPIAVILLLNAKKFHRILSAGWKRWASIGVTAASLAFCLYNSFGNEPIVDFRPFKNGVNIKERKIAEEKALSDVKITHWLLKNRNTGQEVTLTNKEYMEDKGWEKYKKDDGWDVKDQIKSTPSVERTKISDFSLNDKEGSDISEQILSEPGYTFLVTSWKLKSETDVKTVILPDSIFRFDTVKMKISGVDTFDIKKVFEKIGQREETFKSFRFDEEYRKSFSGLNDFMAQAEKTGCKVAGVVPFNDPKKIEDFRHAAQTAYPFYTADDILLKTMIRSNPGIFLLKNGQIIQKWHISKLPKFDEVKSNFLK